MKHRILTIILSGFFLFLILGLFYNQIIRYPYYSNLSKNNSIRIIPITGPRGIIYDRNGEALVSNRLSFDVAVIAQEMRSRKKVATALNDILGMSGESIIAAFGKADVRPYAPVKIAEDVGKEKAMALEEASVDIDGIIVQTSSKRDYIKKSSGSHIYGYLGQISESELERLRDYGYQSRDLIGRGGIEKSYDKYLKGVDGGTQVQVDSRGKQTRTLGVKEPANGSDLYLTIDSFMQSKCDSLLGDRKGVIILMDPNNGEILALASSPAFDPNIFIRPNSSSERMTLIRDRRRRPMINRALSGLYPPGSVFKIVTASAALESGRISRYTSFFCNGGYKLGRTIMPCWKRDGHKNQDVVQALMNSCNVYFYNAGRIIGVDQIESYARKYGFGRPTGIDLPSESRGNLPGKSWKMRNRREAWYDGDTLNYSIGQGYLLVTPLQVLNMAAVIASNGYLSRPHLVKRIGNKDVNVARPKDVGLKASTINIIRQGMYEAVNNVNGTAKRAKPNGIKAAGKTGTAQAPRGEAHAWFCGFAPYDKPKLCLVVMIEHGGKGGARPAVIARGVFEAALREGLL